MSSWPQQAPHNYWPRYHALTRRAKRVVMHGVRMIASSPHVRTRAHCTHDTLQKRRCHKCGTPLAARQPPAPPACHARLCTTTGGRGMQTSWTRGAKLTSFAARLPFDAASMVATRRCVCVGRLEASSAQKIEGDIRIVAHHHHDRS
jgi:hypothetical protein